MTGDGKLAPANRVFVPFGSKRDHELLLELRSRADAVMSGARTVDLSAVNLGPGPARFRRKRLRRGLAESAQAARQFGVKKVLPKPFTRRELLAAVRESIEP